MITLDSLHKRFRKVEAVNGLTLEVPAGQVTALLGPNGAGKSTTLRCLLNLERPDSGTATVMGIDSVKLRAEHYAQLGYVSENMELPLWMRVEQFLDYCRPLYSTWDRSFEQSLMRQFDLPAKTKLRDLSRGMRMKAALLSSLAYRPKLVVLDEPFSGLDPLVRDEFIHGLLELTEQEGWTVLVSSHDIEEVQRLADRVAILNRGRLALCEDSDSLQSRFRAVEVTLPTTEPFTQKMPPAWMHGEQAGRILRFVVSNHSSEEHLSGAIRSTFPDGVNHSLRAMSLREIFVTLARAYRLEGAAW
jgi:ABC-2 type transport system ATP-binding protein